jgi:hypothetical protein
MIYIEDVEPHFIITQLALLESDTFSLFVLLLALGVEALLLEGLSSACIWCFYHWKVLQLGFHLALH